ncbi:DNA repair protein rad52 [Elasticomyces elasticus]|nr:DNA repair protein rad52 [Elasticomyces elasticus]
MPAPGDQHRENKASVNPFVDQGVHINEYTAQEIATLSSRLEKQLGPEYISTRPGAGGGKVHYLAAEKVINLANEVFGFNGWSSAIQQVQIDFDIGYGHIENCKGKAAAFEKAKKEAATDALKRALRNFGNVLGNCLYDKDYLQRVTKVKVAPSKWDADNLHRHPDYAPIKRESIAGADVGKENRPPRVHSMPSTLSAGTEYEDEFGGNLFDGVDFTHPDEVRLDDTITDTSVHAPGQGSSNGPVNGAESLQAHQRVKRVESMPAMQHGNSLQTPQNRVQQDQVVASEPRGPPRPPPNVTTQKVDHGQIRMPPPVQHTGAPRRSAVQQQQQSYHAPPAQRPLQQASDTRSNPSSGDAVLHHQPQRPSHSNRLTTDTNIQPSTTLTPPIPQQQLQLLPQPPQQVPQTVPSGHEPPPGFLTGRALAADPTIQPPSNPAFNPHAESPSIRRTHGVNPGRSAPIKRTALGNSGSGVPPQTADGPPLRTNFVNPAADMGRRIGMPGGGVSSPLANRGSYKPPTAVKRPAPAPLLTAADSDARPPLADVSNMQQADGAGDAKRQKIEERAGEVLNGFAPKP